jgi:hypothetical protein
MRDYNECHTYINHLLAEHRRLHSLLRMASSAINQSGAPDNDATPVDVATILRHAREELQHHFAEEEGGGCLEEAVARCPSLSAEAKRIEAEHPDLLCEIDRLIAQAEGEKQTVESHVELRHRFDDLRRQLQAHEVAENALLRQAFGVNVNGNEGDENYQPTLVYDI